MNDALDPQNDLTDRLSALGRQPVGSALQSEHLTAMAGETRGASWRSALGSRVKIGAAVLGGFLIGTTGLATAGVLGPMQSIAKTSVEAVTPLHVPDSADDEAKNKADEAKDKAEKDAEAADETASDSTEVKEAKNWAGCVDGYSHKNRGQYLKSAKEDTKDPTAFETARKSDCGKSMSEVGADDNAKVENETDKPETDQPETDSGKSADKRQDGDHKSERGGKSGVTDKPESTPVIPDPSTERHDAPEATETQTPETDHSGTSGSGTSGSGSDDSGHSGSGSGH